MNKFLNILFFILASFFCNSQNDSLKTKKGKIYFSWGYTRAGYSKSNIHFEDHSNNFHEYHGKNNYYDFTIYKVKASDQPDFNKIPDIKNITIPQNIFRIGYYFNETCGIEFNMDHTKYVVNDWQRVHIKGQFNGNYVDKDTTLHPDEFLHFEHTDGANFCMFNFLKRWYLYKDNNNFNLSWVTKSGAGFVYPRTDVTLFGEHLNNDWHIAGWIIGFETGFRAEFLKRGVFEFTSKGSYADFRKCLVLGKGNGSANHSFFTFQVNATLGLQFDLKKKAK